MKQMLFIHDVHNLIGIIVWTSSWHGKCRAFTDINYSDRINYITV